MMVFVLTLTCYRESFCTHTSVAAFIHVLTECVQGQTPPRMRAGNPTEETEILHLRERSRHAQGHPFERMRAVFAGRGESHFRCIGAVCRTFVAWVRWVALSLHRCGESHFRCIGAVARAFVVWSSVCEPHFTTIVCKTSSIVSVASGLGWRERDLGDVW